MDKSGRPFRISRPDSGQTKQASRPGSTTSQAPSKAPPRPSEQPEAHEFVERPTRATEPSRSSVDLGSSGRGKRVLRTLVFLVALVVLVLGGYATWSKLFTNGSFPVLDGYQAVTTVNGDVFFGKVKPAGADYVEIDNGYFLQPATSSSDDDEVTNTGKLVRLANRLYAPDGNIIISKSQILSFEALDPDGQIVQMMGGGD